MFSERMDQQGSLLTANSSKSGATVDRMFPPDSHVQTYSRRGSSKPDGSSVSDMLSTSRNYSFSLQGPYRHEPSISVNNNVLRYPESAQRMSPHHRGHVISGDDFLSANPPYFSEQDITDNYRYLPAMQGISNYYAPLPPSPSIFNDMPPMAAYAQPQTADISDYRGSLKQYHDGRLHDLRSRRQHFHPADPDDVRPDGRTLHGPGLEHHPESNLGSPSHPHPSVQNTHTHWPATLERSGFSNRRSVSHPSNSGETPTRPEVNAKVNARSSIPMCNLYENQDHFDEQPHPQFEVRYKQPDSLAQDQQRQHYTSRCSVPFSRILFRLLLSLRNAWLTCAF